MKVISLLFLAQLCANSGESCGGGGGDYNSTEVTTIKTTQMTTSILTTTHKKGKKLSKIVDELAYEIF